MMFCNTSMFVCLTAGKLLFILSFWGGKIITQNFFKCTIGTTCVTLLVVVSGEIVSEHFEERMFANMRT